MFPAPPEELSNEEIRNLVTLLKEKYPAVFADCIEITRLGSFQHLVILDTMLMDHPDLYITLFEQEPER